MALAHVMFTLPSGLAMRLSSGVDTTGSKGLNDGKRYNRVSNVWAEMPATVPTPRYNHTAVWTGNELIIWGGNNGTSDTNNGAVIPR